MSSHEDSCTCRCLQFAEHILRFLICCVIVSVPEFMLAVSVLPYCRNLKLQTSYIYFIILLVAKTDLKRY